MTDALRSTRAIAFVIFALAVSACSPVRFDGAQNSPASPGVAGPTGGGTCTGNNVEAIYRTTKIIFVVDQSRSNVSASFNPGSADCPSEYVCRQTPATDPQKAFRGGAISDFLNRYQHKTNFRWGFVTFSGGSARALINNGNNQSPILSPGAQPLQMALNTFYYTADDGDTPYGAALSMAARAIQNDPELRAPSRPNYNVIMLTDGFPTDYYDSYGNFLQQRMDSDLNSVLRIAPGQVTLSTIYYGQTSDPQAMQLLNRMASMGNGRFASVSVPNYTGFRIDDVIPGSQQGCP